jgi:hypothetical protein
MATYSPLILISGFFSQLPPGDRIAGVSTSGELALELAAYASGVANQALVSGTAALASGNAALLEAAEALASGNAALVDAKSALDNISGYSLAPSGAFGGKGASIVLLSDLALQSQVNISGQGGLAVQFETNVITISGGTGGALVPTGSGTDQVFFLNDTVISGSYTIPSGKNAMTCGPLTQLSGVVVTIPSGSVWTIV